MSWSFVSPLLLSSRLFVIIAAVVVTAVFSALLYCGRSS